MAEIKSRYTETSTGYVKLYVPGVGVVGEHRYVMEQYLERSLAYNEVVHHKDGNGQNNALKNLEVMDKSTHARLHATTGRPMVTLACASCGESFARAASNVKSRRKFGQEDFYCNRSCAARAFGRGRPK